MSQDSLQRQVLEANRESGMVLDSSRFDLSAPFDYIKQQMQIALSVSSWPNESVENLSHERRAEEKALVKGLLRTFDHAYNEKFGCLVRLPFRVRFNTNKKTLCSLGKKPKSHFEQYISATES